jgi:hypothetical protein
LLCRHKIKKWKRSVLSILNDKKKMNDESCFANISFTSRRIEREETEGTDQESLKAYDIERDTQFLVWGSREVKAAFLVNQKTSSLGFSFFLFLKSDSQEQRLLIRL